MLIFFVVANLFAATIATTPNTVFKTQQLSQFHLKQLIQTSKHGCRRYTIDQYFFAKERTS